MTTQRYESDVERQMTQEPEGATKAVFIDAAKAFTELMSQIRPPDWDRSALGVWSVRDLVGHTSRALSTIETYLGKESAAGTLDGPVAYFLAARALLADPEAVAQRGRDAGAALGDDAATRVAELAHRVTALVRQSGEDHPVGTPVGMMTLGGYLPTRTFELTVHSLDLARALGITPPPGLEPGIGASCELAGRLAAHSADAPALLMALTGRADLRSGFTIL